MYSAYPANVIANYFLQKAGNDDSLTPMKLIKLVYLAHGWTLAITNQPLIGERVFAWTYGPVIHSLYHSLKFYGNSPVKQLLDDAREDEIPLQKDTETQKILDRVWETYGRYTAIQLSNLTHEPGSPWRTIYDKYRGDLPPHCVIDDVLIKDFYKNKGKSGHRAAHEN